jgi:hypothetical protein
VQRLLLQAHIQQRGLGDVGPVLRVRQGTDEVLYTHRRVHHRSLKTILGLLVITRMGYSRDGSASISSSGWSPTITRRFSYELQKRAVKAAVPGACQESVARLAETMGVSLPKRSLEEIILDAAQDFDAF